MEELINQIHDTQPSELNIKALEKFLLLVMLFHTDKNKNVPVKISTLGGLTGLSERTITRYIKHFTELNYLEESSVYSEITKTKHKIYHLDFGKLDELTRHSTL